MPIYEYKCDHCGAVIEKQQGMNDEPLKECPHCGGLLRRVFHPAGLIFKGSGFHITDYVKPEQDRKSKNARSAAEGNPGGNSGSDVAKTGEGSGKTEAAGSDPMSKASGDTSTVKAPTGSSSESTSVRLAGGTSDKKSRQTEKK